MITERQYIETENLTKEDYIHGFGFDKKHYERLFDVRKKSGLKVSSNYKQTFETREGYAIDGTKLTPRYHPLHDYYLIENDTKRKILIDCVAYHYHYGNYIVLLTREEGTNSHGVVYWENINCIDKSMVEIINETKNEYTLCKK